MPARLLWSLVLLNACVLPFSSQTVDHDGDGYSEEDGDCDDFNPAVHPRASEVSAGEDRDCDGVVALDEDGDGYISVETGGDDCGDTNPEVHPGAEEQPTDGIDQDCDGVDDCYTDVDGDGYAGHGASPGNSLDCSDEGVDGYDYADDCDDDRDHVYPGADETCGDGVVNDCEGSASEACEECWAPATVTLNNADWSYVGPDGSLFGTAVAAVGDINGDGAPDFAVGAYGEQTGASGDGAVHLFSGITAGGAGSFAQPIATLTGVDPGTWTGYDISGAGDVNKDGADDLLVASLERTERGGEGSAYLVLGPITGDESLSDAEVGFRGTGDTQGFAFGASIGRDLTGDDVDDLLITTRDSGADNPVLAYVFAGSTGFTGGALQQDLDSTHAHSIVSHTATERTDVSVSGTIADDIDGDGMADLLLGVTPYQDCNASEWPGAAYLFTGADVAAAAQLATGDASATLAGATSDECTGGAVASGDLNQDGVSDIIVGVRGAKGASGGNAGRVYVVLGGTDVIDRVEQMATIDAAPSVYNGDDSYGTGGLAGYSVATASNPLCDEEALLLIGAPHAETNHRGVTYLVPYQEGQHELSAATHRFLGDASWNEAGGAVAGVGDVNGDGFGDLLIGARHYNSQTNKGAAYLILWQGY